MEDRSLELFGSDWDYIRLFLLRIRNILESFSPNRVFCVKKRTRLQKTHFAVI